MSFIIKLELRQLKKVFWAVFVASFICNTTLILHGNNAWIGMLGFVVGKFGTNLENDIISHLSRLQYTLGWYKHLYLKL